MSMAESIDMADVDADNDDDDDETIVRRHERLNLEVAALLDVFHRVGAALRDTREAQASPTNDSMSSLQRSASFTSQMSLPSSPQGSPLRKHSITGLRSPSIADMLGSPASSSIVVLRSTSMRGAASQTRQSLITLEEPDQNLTHETSPELAALKSLVSEGLEALQDGHRGAALVTSLHKVSHRLRSLEKENKKLEALYGAGMSDCSVFPEETLEIGNNDIARVAASHQQALSRLQIEHTQWRTLADDCRRLAGADERKLHHMLEKIELQADNGLRRGETVEELRQLSKMESKLIDSLKYAVLLEGMNLRKLQVLRESREIVSKFKSLTPQPRKSQLVQQHGTLSTVRRQQAVPREGEDSPMWALNARGANNSGSPFVSKVFAPESGQEQRLLRLRKGALLLKTAPM
jgi:hypothetical protein